MRFYEDLRHILLCQNKFCINMRCVVTLKCTMLTVITHRCRLCLMCGMWFKKNLSQVHFSFCISYSGFQNINITLTNIITVS